MTLEEIEQIKKEEQANARIGRLVLSVLGLFIAGMVAYSVVSNIKEKNAAQEHHEYDNKPKDQGKKTASFVSEYNKMLYAMNKTR